MVFGFCGACFTFLYLSSILYEWLDSWGISIWSYRIFFLRWMLGAQKWLVWKLQYIFFQKDIFRDWPFCGVNGTRHFHWIKLHQPAKDTENPVVKPIPHYRIHGTTVYSPHMKTHKNKPRVGKYIPVHGSYGLRLKISLHLFQLWPTWTFICRLIINHNLFWWNR